MPSKADLTTIFKSLLDGHVLGFADPICNSVSKIVEVRLLNSMCVCVCVADVVVVVVVVVVVDDDDVVVVVVVHRFVIAIFNVDIHLL